MPLVPGMGWIWTREISACCSTFIVEGVRAGFHQDFIAWIRVQADCNLIRHGSTRRENGGFFSKPISGQCLEFV